MLIGIDAGHWKCENGKDILKTYAQKNVGNEKIVFLD